MSIEWRNPYEDVCGQWLKGNLHTHTSFSGCGTLPVDRVLELYIEHGYDFLSISDHMQLTLATDHAPAALTDRLTLIPGVEWNAPGPRGHHTGVYGFDLELLRRCPQIEDQRQLLAMLEGTDALVILNHPNWQLVPHYRREELLACGEFHGVEVYNHVIERLDGYAISSDKWDFLLQNGRRVLGFASDDSHIEDDINGAAIHVRAKSRDGRAILDAMRRGNFYMSSGGMTLGEVTRKGDVVSVTAPTAQEICAFANGGCRIARTRGTALSVDFKNVPGEYVRFEAYGIGASMAWTQPLFKQQ